MIEYKQDILTFFMLMSLFVMLTIYFLVFSIPLVVYGVITDKKYLVEYADKITDTFIKE